MKSVKIYDNYAPIYLDNETNSLKKIYLKHGEVIDEDRYTLVHSSSGLTEIYEASLDEQSAYSFVYSLYENTKNLGESYEDILLEFDKGYAELSIKFNDGRVLNRVIFVKDI